MHGWSDPITGRGSAPATPKFLALRSSGWAKKRAGCALPIRLLTHLGAQVALQQSLILRVSRKSIANLFYKWDGSIFLIKVGKILDEATIFLG
jgi:hypothetical protein